MDQGVRKLSRTKINVIGYSHVLPENFSFETYSDQATIFDVKPCLKNKKDFKFLSKQDSLSLLAATNAWKMADIKAYNPDHIGIYLAVGVLPFEDKPLEKLATISQKNGLFDMKTFSDDGFRAMNPMLTFKCLPNMPLFHISYNLEITGRYFMTYPGIPNWVDALEKAISDLETGVVEYAIVGAAADQRNFLVKNYFKRIFPDNIPNIVDSSSVLVLTAKEHKNIFATINNIESNYIPFDPFSDPNKLQQTSSYFKSHMGIVAPSLYCSLNIEKGTKGNLTYTHIDGEETICKIEMELL